MHYFWILPLQVILGLASLYKNVGLIAPVAALIVLLATMLLNVPLATLESKFQEQLMRAKDARMKTTSECLGNMRILKLQAWESTFLSHIEELRATEYKYLTRNLYIFAVSAFLEWTSPAIVAIATFTTCILLGVPLTPGRVLSTIATLLVLRLPLESLSDFVAIVAQAKVSLHRLFVFLQEPELPSDCVVRGGSSELHDYAIEVENGTFSWHTDVGEEMMPPTLCGVNLRAQNGAHVAVCGPVGSGKSALLSCMLGEIPKVEGRVREEGQTAYVAQTPWIQTGTFKENICFGRPMDEALYERVLQACDLKKDIAMSTVTGSHLLKECIMGMLASKTVVYVTHKMESLPVADHIVVLRNGVIVQAGKFEDLLQNGTDFSTLILAHNEALENMQTNMNIGEDAELSNNSDIIVEKSNLEISNQQNNDGTSTEYEKDTTRLQQLVKEEERESGQVSYKVYWVYATAVAGGAFIPLYLFSAIGFYSFQILSNYWMAWGTSPTEDGSWQVSAKKLILVYVLLAFSGTSCMLLRSMTVSIIGLKFCLSLYVN